MKYKEYKEKLEKDRLRYGEAGHIKLYIKNAGYKIVTNLRRCEYLRGKKIFFPIYQLQRVKYHRLCVKYGCDIPSHVKIGAGFKLDHPVGVVINSKAIIGENFNIKSGAVIGKTEKGVAKIGDNVMVGVHALIIGNVTIGDDAKIGAGAIVTHDAGEGATVISPCAHER